MKTFDLRDYFNPTYQECIIGSKEICKHSVYLAYGELVEGESRTLAPEGHDEIFLLLSGEAEIHQGGRRLPLTPERAVYLDPEATHVVVALAYCRYVVAGAHAAPHTTPHTH
jgi:mannose-6-phosphate isomerase-like protein (cupin superfamily)